MRTTIWRPPGMIYWGIPTIYLFNEYFLYAIIYIIYKHITINHYSFTVKIALAVVHSNNFTVYIYEQYNIIFISMIVITITTHVITCRLWNIMLANKYTIFFFIHTYAQTKTFKRNLQKKKKKTFHRRA